jgi:hypothetical protein
MEGVGHMSLFYGPIGFVDTVEDPEGSGIWVEKPIARMYRGEVSRNVKRWDNGDQVNPNLNISNTISIVADPYLNDHLNSTRYIGWLGGYWSISSVDVEPPRLVLSIGGVYNGPTAKTTGTSKEYPGV